MFAFLAMTVALAPAVCPNDDGPSIVKQAPLSSAGVEAAQTGTYVRVMLDATGAVTRATITKSGGSKVHDNAVLAEAKKTTYKPKVVCGKGVASHYTFVDI